MCRNIRVLVNYQPPATEDEMRAAALQYVRKVSGSAKPSKTNEAAFAAAVEQVYLATHALLGAMVVSSAPKDRAVEAAKAKERSKKRFAR
jgi:hypothetical protein